MACAALGQIAQSIGGFHVQMNDIKGKIISVNALLTQVCDTLNLPFNIVITVKEKVGRHRRTIRNDSIVRKSKKTE
jgi:hypothetical protein